MNISRQYVSFTKYLGQLYQRLVVVLNFIEGAHILLSYMNLHMGFKRKCSFPRISSNRENETYVVFCM